MTFHRDEVEAASVKRLVQVVFCNNALFSFAAAHLPSQAAHTAHECLEGYVTRFVYDDGLLHSLEDDDFKESMLRVIKPLMTLSKRALRRHRGRCKACIAKPGQVVGVNVTTKVTHFAPDDADDEVGGEGEAGSDDGDFVPDLSDKKRKRREVKSGKRRRRRDDEERTADSGGGGGGGGGGDGGDGGGSSGSSGSSGGRGGSGGSSGVNENLNESSREGYEVIRLKGIKLGKYSSIKSDPRFDMKKGHKSAAVYAPGGGEYCSIGA
jgi:uncharacterized membrane protein YgcG